MSGYTTIVVGTDGSDSSLRAVDKAGQIAAGSDTKVIVATAYFPQSEDHRAADVLKDEGYKMAGLVHRAQRRIRSVRADHDGRVAAHPCPPSVLSLIHI